METLSLGNITLPEPARARMMAELAAASDEELLALVRSLPARSERRSQVCELLVERYRGLVRSCVRPYRNSPESFDDLMQVGFLGLMKAINGYDPSFGRSLIAYAHPCITGELKRHFRDKRWQVHVDRPVQERLLRLRQLQAELVQQSGGEPSDANLATLLECTEAQVREARQAADLMSPASLDAPLGDRADGLSLADSMGEEDRAVEHLLSMQALSAHWAELPQREQRILLMRFYGEMTQADIGKALGISQMHVSRLLARALAYLRERVVAPPGMEADIA
jgi:RNA polymerase sigma-B factor